MFDQYLNLNGSYYPVVPEPPRVPERFIKPGFYTAEHHSRFGWGVTPKTLETDKLVQVPGGTSEKVIQEIQKFWTKREVFQGLGVMYKRGILLYGAPGTGKTCTIELVANHLVNHHQGFVLYLDSDPDYIADLLKAIRQVEPQRPVLIVIEDLDEALQSYERELTSLLDGPNSVDGVVYLATTNYIDSIPEKLKNRPSRFDMVEEVPLPCKELRASFLTKFPIDQKLKDEIAELGEGLSFAHLKEVVISVVCYDRTVKDEIARMGGLGKTAAEPDNDDN